MNENEDKIREALLKEVDRYRALYTVQCIITDNLRFGIRICIGTVLVLVLLICIQTWR